MLKEAEILKFIQDDNSPTMRKFHHGNIELWLEVGQIRE